MIAKARVIAALTVCVTAVAACGGDEAETSGAAAADSAKSVKWNMQAVSPENFPNGQATVKFSELLKTNSGGTIDLKVHLNSGLNLAPAQMVDLTTRRAVDVGELIGQFVEPSFVESNLPSVPGFVPYDLDTQKNVEEALRPAYADILHEKDMEYLGYCQAGPRSLVSTKPIKSLADLKGLKISANGGTAEVELTRALGANAVPNLATAELYTALQTGVVDAAWSPDGFFLSAKMHEVAKHLLDLRLGGSTVMWAVSGQAWKELSAEQQEQVRKSAREALDECWTLNHAAQDDAVAGLKAQDVTVTDPSDADVQELATLTAPLVEKWSSSQGARAPELVEKARSAM